MPTPGVGVVRVVSRVLLATLRACTCVDVEVRRATAADAEGVARVLAEASQGHAHLYTPDALAVTAPPADILATRLLEGPTWVAMDAGVVVGTESIVLRAEGAYIRALGVDPRHRGRNIGTRLLHEVERFGTAAGAARMCLGTTPFLHAAI